MSTQPDLPQHTAFDYLLNAFEHASQAEKPADHAYGDKRRALYAHVRALEADSRKLADLTRRLEAAEADARRYRWLNGPDSEWEPFDSRWLTTVDLYGQTPDDMDAFIDAALAASSAQSEPTNSEKT